MAMISLFQEGPLEKRFSNFLRSLGKGESRPRGPLSLWRTFWSVFVLVGIGVPIVGAISLRWLAPDKAATLSFLVSAVIVVSGCYHLYRRKNKGPAE